MTPEKPSPRKPPAAKPPAGKPTDDVLVAAPVAAKAKAKAILTEKEVGQLRAVLEEQRAIHERELTDLEIGSFDISQSELSGEVSFDEEYADAGTFTFERERDLSLSNNVRDLLTRVNRALTKIEAGTYGICERCHQPIDKARIKALPYSHLCIRCKQLEERAR